VAVVADMIEGMVVANQLVPPVADRLRAEMWLALGFVAQDDDSRRSKVA
jgi:hypothetical protein